ncbi:MAG TPA: hypothetical protein VEQ84_09580 [Vicinamibacteria bacterium]|nr:hypothetical protein [Vicinamibacteria bacterium]
MRSPAAAVAVLLWAAAGAGAQGTEPEEPIQELFVGETAFVQARREVQLTTGFDGRKNAGEKTWTAAQIVQYGVTDWLELDAKLPFVSGPESTALRHAGFGDVEVGLLVGLARHIRAGALSVGARVRLPTGNEAKGHGEGETVPEPVLIYGKAFGKVQLHASAEVGFANKRTPKEWTYGAGLVLPSGRWRETLELDARHEGDESRLLLTPGLYLKPRHAFEIGIGIPIGLTQRSPDVGAVILATLELDGR